MPRFKFNVLCIAVSLLFLGSCKIPGPLVSTCVSNPDAFGLECVDREEKPYFVHYANSQAYVCYSAQDHKSIVDWINARMKSMKVNSNDQEEVRDYVKPTSKAAE